MSDRPPTNIYVHSRLVNENSHMSRHVLVIKESHHHLFIIMKKKGHQQNNFVIIDENNTASSSVSQLTMQKVLLTDESQ